MVIRVQAPTELRNPRTLDLDQLDTLSVLRRINDEDVLVPHAVAEVLPALATVVDRAVEALRGGARVHYFGAGSSGRIAAADAAELGPTYGLADGRVIAHHAGGHEALLVALEGVEDDRQAGAQAADGLGPSDVAIGVAASGRTPYVAGALARARELGAHTVLLSANPEALLADQVDVHLCVDTGPEVLTGSTRMKAATAQKLVLNAFSTATMVRLGYTWSNLMSGLEARNEKLRGRTIGILVEATGESDEVCERVLEEADGVLAQALVVLLAGVEQASARDALATHGGVVRTAVAALTE